MKEHRKSTARGRRRRTLGWGMGVALWLCTAGAAAQTLTLNLKEADLEAVIETVAEMTGRNFIVDPRVKGKVTVISSEPMNADEIYDVFLSVLNVHGFAAVPVGNAVKIVPEVNAKQDSIPLVAPPETGTGDQYVTRVIKVDNVPAAQLVPILRPLLPQQGHLAALPEANVLIAAAGAANLERLVRIIERVDRTGDEPIEIIRLEHASATEVVRILEALQQAEAKARGAAADAATLVADERTNSILVGGGADRLKLRTIISHLDTPLATEGNTEVIYLRYASATDLVDVLTGVSRSIEAEAVKQQTGAAPAGAAGAAGARRGGDEVTIHADETTNAIIISAPPDVMRGLRQVIQKLDIRRAQVMVEAIIAEVSADRESELGILWGVDGSDRNNPIGVVNFGGAQSPLTGLLSDPPSVGDGLSLLLGDTGDSSGNRFGALLRALAGDADTNVLSTPTLVTLDNEAAEIVVGQNVPFVTGSYTSTGDGTSPNNPFQTIQRQDVGLTLKVKPQINEGNAVRLEIEQEVSSIAAAATGASDLITNKRSLKTTVLVDNGEVLVLGGLVDDNVRESEQKVPGLGDVPLLGNLFKYRKTSKVKRNLMVFMHPVIMRTNDQNALVTSEKYNYIRARQLDIRQQGLTLMPNQESPVIPEWEELRELPPPFEATDAGLHAPGAEDGSER